MSSDDDKKRWKDESEILKNDLKNRQKKVQLNPVDIKFPPTQKPKTPSKPQLGSQSDDRRLRDFLGI